jgi:cob(I)alamin adenosyltransferase
MSTRAGTALRLAAGLAVTEKIARRLAKALEEIIPLAREEVESLDYHGKGDEGCAAAADKARAKLDRAERLVASMKKPKGKSR